jgi:hypothetical protein
VIPGENEKLFKFEPLRSVVPSPARRFFEISMAIDASSDPLYLAEEPELIWERE